MHACISGLARLSIEASSQDSSAYAGPSTAALGRPATKISLLSTPSTPAFAPLCGRAPVTELPHGNSHLFSAHHYQLTKMHIMLCYKLIGRFVLRRKLVVDE